MIRFDALPTGVWPIKDYPSLGATLVECEHAAEHQRPTGGWAAYRSHRFDDPDGDLSEYGRSELRQVAGPELSEREARELLGLDETLDYGGRLICRICKADETDTESFAKPVKMLAIVPTVGSLF